MRKREKTLGLAVVVVLVLACLYQFVFTPYIDQRAADDEESAKLDMELTKARKVLRERDVLARKYNDTYLASLKTGEEAESQVQHALEDWSKDAGVTVSSRSLDRPESKDQVKEIQVQLTGTGSFAAVVQFLFRIREASFPLKMTDLKIGSRSDSTNLTMEAKLSTLYLGGETKTAKAEKPDSGEPK